MNDAAKLQTKMKIANKHFEKLGVSPIKIPYLYICSVMCEGFALPPVDRFVYSLLLFIVRESVISRAFLKKSYTKRRESKKLVVLFL